MNTRTIKSYNARVSKGIAWLNKNKPNWVKKIDLEKLNLSNARVCMLGQTFDSFWDKVRETGERDPVKMSWEQAEKLGFCENERGCDNYDLLTHIWFTRVFQLKFGCKIK